MIEFLLSYQLNIMLALSGICAIIALFAVVTKTLPKRRRWSLVYLEMSASILLYMDRLAYLYQGDVSIKGYWLVRITNFFVFFMTITCVHSFNLYVADVCKKDLELKSVPRRLKLCEILLFIGIILIIISQFTGIYYTFDEKNIYHRGDAFFISYIIPFIVIFLQFSVIIQYYKKMNKMIAASLIIFTVIPIIASIVQFFTYGVSLTDIAVVGVAVILYIFALAEMNETVEKATKMQIDYLKEQQQTTWRMFEQTAKLLASIIDSKDEHSDGHSRRVAIYSKMLAEHLGKDKRTCEEIYYTALLHDVGKIELPDHIINNKVSLTEEEKELFKTHAKIGGERLASSISEFPFLSQGAMYHHERFDGKGYPEGLKGDKIPEIARIIAVADSYDLLTSKTDSHDIIPQRTVREEILKGSGTKFDPKFAKIMVDIIDNDHEYQLRETDDSENKKSSVSTDLTKITKMHFKEYKDCVSDGIRVTERKTRVHFEVKAEEGIDNSIAIPTIVLFDSLDGLIHKDDRGIRILNYIEYGEIWLDGHTICTAARDIKSDIISKDTKDTGLIKYDLELVKYHDHVRVKIKSGKSLIDVIIALPDSVRFVYFGLTGEHCYVKNISVEVSKNEIDESYIPRIVDEISFIDHIEGDLPNVQIDGYRTSSTKPIPVSNGMRLNFHTMSLPTASLIWQCAYILIFSAENAKVNGNKYKELACIRLDGEDATNNDDAINDLTVHKDDTFSGWDHWKDANKRGLECEVAFLRRRNKVTIFTKNEGISIKNVTTLPGDKENIYVAITGDQCALTDIRIQ